MIMQLRRHVIPSWESIEIPPGNPEIAAITTMYQ